MASQIYIVGENVALEKPLMLRDRKGVFDSHFSGFVNIAEDPRWSIKRRNMVIDVRIEVLPLLDFESGGRARFMRGIKGTFIQQAYFNMSYVTYLRNRRYYLQRVLDAVMIHWRGIYVPIAIGEERVHFGRLQRKLKASVRDKIRASKELRDFKVQQFLAENNKKTIRRSGF